MTSTFATPLHFAVQLLAVFVAVGAALTMFREPGARPTRFASTLGFLALAAAEALHGGDFGSELGGAALSLRTAAYVLLFAAALVPIRAHGAVPAIFALSAQTIAPTAAAALASLAWLRRRSDPGRLALGGGLALLAASEALLGSAAEWSGPASHILRLAGYSVVAVRILRATRQSIRFRFMAGFVSALLVVVLAVTVAVTQVIDRNVREGALARLRSQAVETSNRLEPLVRQQARSLVVLVETLVRSVVEGEEVSPEEVADLQASLLPDVDFILFLDAQGLELGRTGLDPGQATDVAGTTVVQACLSGGDAASLDALGEDQLALIGCATMRRGPSLAGVAVAGYLVDGELLDQITPPGGAAVAFRGSEPVPVAVTGTFPGHPVGAPMLTEQRLGGLIEDFLGDRATHDGIINIAGERYFVAFVPLRRTGSVVGVLMTAEAAAVAGRTQQEIVRLVFLLTLAAVALALLLALFAARRITQPVLALTRAARRVQAGELGAKADVRAEDEVGDLAAAFNQMTDSVTDATEKLRASAEEEARLRTRLETVLNSMGDGLLAMNEDGHIVTYNPAAAMILGLPEKRVLGRPIQEVVQGRDIEDRELDLSEEETSGIAFLRRSDGRDVPVAITSTPLRNASGVPLGRVLVLRDMTREHEVERMKTEFLANVSHELRTPLTPIIGYSEIMARRGVPVDRSQEFAGAILDSARRLERIVAMLVDFSAMEGGRMSIEAETTSLRKLVKTAIDEWRERSPVHRFVAKFDQGLPEADLDTSLMRRALDELLDNAVKYSPNGGNIRVSVSSPNSQSRRILRIDVEDEGIGIEREDLAGVFEDFRQVDASDTRTFGGLGLGLAFVRRIVEAHRGTIAVESAPGQGSSFSITIPAADTPKRRKST